MIRRAVSVLAYPCTLGGSVFLANAALRGGRSVAEVTVAAAVFVSLVVFVLERLLPFEPSWNVSRGDVLVDLVHLPTTAVAAELGRALAATLVVWALPTGVRFSPFLTALPLPLALLLAALLADLPVYIIHRWQHERAWLWRIHAAHHAVTRIYFLNGNRNHPFDVFLGALVSLGLLGAVGASAQIIALVGVATTVHLIFQHSNVDVRLGPLNYVLSSPEVHRFHHDRSAQVGNANYGGFTLFWDILGGTRHVPARRPSADVGLEGGRPFPTSVLGVLASPFRKGLFP